MFFIMQGYTGVCAQCDGDLRLPADTQVAEVVSCGECGTRLVVDDVTMDTASVSVAPQVEEDWGQ